MYFQVKNILKNNCNHTLKPAKPRVFIFFNSAENNNNNNKKNLIYFLKNNTFVSYINLNSLIY